MRYFDIILENKTLYYRGLMQTWSDDYAKTQHIIFVTSDKEYARAYAKDENHITTFNVELGNIFDFGFRTLTTEVKLADVVSRIKLGLISQFKHNHISKSLGLQLMADLNSIQIPGFHKIYDWYMTVPELSMILKKAGFDSISGNEGENNDIQTYGLLNRSQLTVL